MAKILIADALKSSLVMSSEVFKDKIPGSTILVASTGERALQLIRDEQPDICVIDFDLPDTDGPGLIVEVRRFYTGPILLTAYPDASVEQAVSEDLFAYSDSSAWIRKPVRFEDLAQRIEHYLLERRRTGKRFDVRLPAQIVGKADGRGKRAPKSEATITNLSLGGASFQLDADIKLKKNQEVLLSFPIPAQAMPRPTLTTKKSKAKIKGDDAKVKGTIAWVTREGHIGVQFAKLSEAQQKSLENYLRLESRNVG